MWSAYVSTIDFFGKLIPGFLFVLAVIFNPLVYTNINDSLVKNVVRDIVGKPFGTIAPFVLIVLLLVIAYSIGFLLRLGGVRLLEKLTLWLNKRLARPNQPNWLRRILSLFVGQIVYVNWGEWTRQCLLELDPLLKDQFDENVIKAVKSTSQKEVEQPFMQASVHRYAPLFPLLSRLTRINGPEIRSEREHYEVEIRLMVGMFWPMVLWMITGGCLLFCSHFRTVGLFITVFSILGLRQIISHFPERRLHEVLYTYYLVIAAFKSKSPVEVYQHTKEERVEENHENHTS